MYAPEVSIVDGDVLESFEAIAGTEPGNDALDDLADGAPSDAQKPRRCGPIHDLRELRAPAVLDLLLPLGHRGGVTILRDRLRLLAPHAEVGSS